MQGRREASRWEDVVVSNIKRWASATLVASLFAACPAAAAPDTLPTATLTYATESLPKSWAPQTPLSNEWAHLLYETLVQRSPDGSGKVLPLLATHWEQTSTSLTLHLRSDVLFHDGTPFDVSAVKTNIDLRLTEGGFASGNLKAIRNVEVVDANTVRFDLQTPNPFLLFSLTGVSLGMGSPKAFADGTIARHPVGTGPMQFDQGRTIPGGKVVLDVFPRYWNLPQVHFGRIEVTPVGDAATRVLALKTGRFDMVRLEANVRGLMKGAPDLKSVGWPAYHSMLIFFDRAGVFRDVRVRRAVCYALDTEKNSRIIGPDVAVATGQRFGVGEYGHSPDFQGYAHDLDKARRLMAEAGNPKIAFTIPTIAGTLANEEAMARQLREIGIDVKVEPMPLQQYLSAWRSGKYPAGVGLLGTADDLYSFYQVLVAPDGPFNYTHVRTPEADAVVAKALAIDDLAKAEVVWRDVSRIVAEEAITCADMERNMFLAYNAKRLGNVAGFVGFSATPLWRDIRPVDEQ